LPATGSIAGAIECLNLAKEHLLGITAASASEPQENTSMGYTRESLELAVKRIVDSLGGVRHLFSHHRLHRDGQDLETFEAEWPALPLESRVGKLACLVGPSRIGDCGLITRAYWTSAGRTPCTSRQN
jgi:hypothetical protein